LLVSSLILACFAGQLKQSKFAPGEFVTALFAGAPDRPISKHRALVTPVKRGKGDKRQKTVKQMTVHPQNVTPR